MLGLKEALHQVAMTIVCVGVVVLWGGVVGVVIENYGIWIVIIQIASRLT